MAPRRTSLRNACVRACSMQMQPSVGHRRPLRRSNYDVLVPAGQAGPLWRGRFGAGEGYYVHGMSVGLFGPQFLRWDQSCMYICMYIRTISRQVGTDRHAMRADMLHTCVRSGRPQHTYMMRPRAMYCTPDPGHAVHLSPSICMSAAAHHVNAHRAGWWSHVLLTATRAVRCRWCIRP